MTALHVLIKNKASIEAIKILLENGIDVNVKREQDGKTALHMAAVSKDTELFQHLLEDKADVLMQDYNKTTVLMTVIREVVPSEKQEFLVTLVLTKLNISDITYLNLQDCNGWTALHYATMWGQRNLIHQLLCWKPDLTCKTVHKGHTALHHVLTRKPRSAKETLDFLRFLVEHENGYHSTEVNIQDLRGRTVLHLALEAKYSRDDAMLEYLSRVVDVSIADQTGETALHKALYYNASQAVISALLGSTQGAVAANMRNGTGMTALHLAMVLRNVEDAWAIARLADVNVSDDEGKTALHHAVQMDQPLFLEFLLHEKNGDAWIRDHQGYTPLTLACTMYTSDRNSQLSLIYHLCQYGVAYGDLQNMM